jgi:hypothetical protein
LEGASESYEQYLTDVDNRLSKPGELSTVTASLNIPSSLPVGEYKVKIKMIKDGMAAPRTVYLALQDKLKDVNNYYEVGSLTIESSSANVPN